MLVISFYLFFCEESWILDWLLLMWQSVSPIGAVDGPLLCFKELQDDKEANWVESFCLDSQARAEALPRHTPSPTILHTVDAWPNNPDSIVITTCAVWSEITKIPIADSTVKCAFTLLLMYCMCATLFYCDKLWVVKPECLFLLRLFYFEGF